MYTISQHVWHILNQDQIALEYLQKGWLNTSAYANDIQALIEKRALIKVTKGSIVTALTRIKQKLGTKYLERPKFVIQDMLIMMPISELVYRKKDSPNPNLSSLYQQLSAADSNSVHLNVINMQHEFDVFVTTSKLDLVEFHMSQFELIFKESSLCAIILKYDNKYREFPGMGSQILGALALQSVHIVECMTTYSEFVIYIREVNLTVATEVLKSNFM